MNSFPIGFEVLDILNTSALKRCRNKTLNINFCEIIKLILDLSVVILVKIKVKQI